MEILTGTREGVLTIEFNRPEKKNALTAAMYQAMADALTAADPDPAVRVILFHGKPDVFTAGNDIQDFLKGPSTGGPAPAQQFLNAVIHARKPLVAAVTGAAVGIGTTLLLHCDLVYAGDNARFSLPFTNLGLVPEFASTYVLPWIAGYQRAAELLLLGEPFGPDRAERAGFVTQVLPAAEALPAARQAAARLAALPGTSVRSTKALLRRAHLKQMEDQLEAESVLFRSLLGEPAAKEAFSAFLERRKPDFSPFA
jgi:enoyl-CoA hydratase/carnithine racemase